VELDVIRVSSKFRKDFC